MPDMKLEDLEQRGGIMRCFNCDKPLSLDFYCNGCGKFVCEECDVNYNLRFGGHRPEEHLEESE